MSSFNFNNFGYDDGGSGGGRTPPGNFPLMRQSSVYSLTFDEFQSTVGGSGKDFGSMNMDELLKSIWSAEENQNNGSTSGVVGVNGQDGLQRQGSLSLPRTISQKTVGEVWSNISKETNNGGVVGFGVPQREPTLGEITLEEFLARAGVVREENQLPVKPVNNGSVGFFNDFPRPVGNSDLGFGFQQQQQQQQPSQLVENNIGNQIGIQPGNLPLSVNGVRSQEKQQILPKQPVLPYGAPLGGIQNTQLGSPRIGGVSDPAMNINSNGMVQNAPTFNGMVGLGNNINNDVSVAKSNGGNITPLATSPIPYAFNGGVRGRKTAILEKVVERRQRRMIKNRESAARSRARKQAYTTELEEEVAKLKEENEELRKKQKAMEMQKNEVVEMMNQRNGGKRRCLRRTQTGLW